MNLDDVVKDKFERPILSLRITITNRCNENCIYCHHDGMVSSKDEMTPDEIYRICKIAKKLGVKKPVIKYKTTPFIVTNNSLFSI